MMISKIEKEFILGVLSGLFIVSSQFYVFSSGSAQPSHIIISFAYILFPLFYKFIYFQPEAMRAVASLLIFSTWGIVVNIFFGIITSSFSFVMSSVFLLFNVILFVFFSQVLHRIKLSYFINSLTIALLTLLLIYLSGLGRYGFAPRYNGFFNDPNQMGFWVLCLFSSLMLLLPRSKVGMLTDLAAFSSVLLILSTQSRSAMLGLLFALVGYFFRRLSQFSLVKRVFLTFISIAYFIYLVDDMPTIFMRVMEEGTFQRLLEINLHNQIDARGFDRIFEYSSYLLFGAGQGMDERFGAHGEIHSTWLGVLFYYGAIGLALLVFALFSIWRRLDTYSKIIFVAPIVYSFTTYGARTPVFWLFLAVALFAATIGPDKVRTG